MLQFDVKVDFHETGNAKDGIPQLNFALPIGYSTSLCRYDVPLGTIDRAAMDYDVPASSFAVPLAEDGTPSLMLISDCKYGFRYARDTVALSLIRASYDPDPYPEYGIHHIRIGVGVCHSTAGDLYRTADAFLHPISYCTADLQTRGGLLPLDHTFLQVAGNVRVTAVKVAEEREGTVVRFFNVGERAEDYRLIFAREICSAIAVDLREMPQYAVETKCNTLCGTLPPYAIATVLVKFR
jgi:alpha-mannosidase